MKLTKPQQLIILRGLDVLMHNIISAKTELERFPEGRTSDYAIFIEERIRLIKETRELISELEFRDETN